MAATVKEMLAAANQAVPRLSPDQAKTKLKEPGVVIVDVRDGTEVAKSGKLKGALNISRGMLEFNADPESPYHKDVFASGKEFVFYCNGAWRSALAADVAQQMGLPRVVEMEGGFTAWKNAGLPVAERTKKPAS